MARTDTVEVANLISNLSEINFKNLVKEYLKAKYKTKHVIITDGPYDGGNDLEITVNDKVIKRNIQVTVQSSNIEKKIEEDVSKSSSNIEKYNYLNALDFYYSRSISKEKQDELIFNAEVYSDVALVIIDANKLAELSDNFEEIKKFLFDIYKTNSLSISKLDKRKKIVYDLLSKGYKTGSLKQQLVLSYILSFVYNHPGCSIEDIYNNLKDVLSDKYDIHFYEKQVGKLIGTGDLYRPEQKKVALSDKAIKVVNNIQEQSSALEALLINQINEYLTTVDLVEKEGELIELLQNLYKENYKVDLDEIDSNKETYNNAVKSVFKGIVKFLTNNGKDEIQAKQITRDLLEICSSSEYMTKIGAAVLFTNLFKSEKLDRYINNQFHNLVIDTQILLRLLCIYDEKGDFGDNALGAVQDFLKTCNKYKQNIRLTTTAEYVEEVVGHIQEALKLNRFLSLPIFEKFGSSKNVIFNYFVSLKGKDLTEANDFVEFMDDLLGKTLLAYDDEKFKNNTFIVIKELLEMLGIETVTHPYYPLYDELMKDYEIELDFKNKYRSYHARKHDIMTLLYLSSQDLHFDENGNMNEPYLITWDGLFYSLRKKFLEKYPDLGNWFIYSPSKFSDKMSVINFDVNCKAINYNVIALTEHNFNHYSTNVSFIDLISSLFNKKDLSQLNLAKKLVDLKNKTLIGDEENTFDEINEEQSPIINILWGVREKFATPGGKFTVKDFGLLLESDLFVDDIVSILSNSISNFDTLKSDLEPAFNEFVKLIDKFKLISPK